MRKDRLHITFSPLSGWRGFCGVAFLLGGVFFGGLQERSFLREPQDRAPLVVWQEAPFITTRQTVRIAYKVSDDQLVQSLFVRVMPHEKKPEDEAVDVLLAAPQRMDIDDTSYVDLSFLPWAGEAISLQLVAIDNAGQESTTRTKNIHLPVRHFHNAFARALIETRNKLLENPEKRIRNEAANVMAGIARQQGDFQKDMISVLALRSGAVRLVINEDRGVMEQTASLLWRVAVRMEEGQIGLYREKMASIYREIKDSLYKEKAVYMPLLEALGKAGEAYFNALGSEQLRIAPVLVAYANASFKGTEASLQEHFQAQLEATEIALKKGDGRAVKKMLLHMEALVENLPTTLPELDSKQDRLARQLSAMQLLVRAQEKLSIISEGLSQDKKLSEKSNKKILDLVEDQQDLWAALKKIITQTDLDLMEVKDSEVVIESVLAALAKGDLKTAHEHQAEVITLLENAVLILSERMTRSLAAVK